VTAARRCWSDLLSMWPLGFAGFCSRDQTEHGTTGFSCLRADWLYQGSARLSRCSPQVFGCLEIKLSLALHMQEAPTSLARWPPANDGIKKMVSVY
jgi:hypothetical protein